ncbi:MAG: cytochrome c biogenesis protein CcdA [Bacteroidota bacterium]
MFDALDVGMFMALIAGVISFASPCVLPIVPGYLSFITGLGLDQLTKRENRSKVLRIASVNSVLFVVGFSIIFVLLGASATAVGNLLREHLDTLGKIAGVVIIILGLHMVGLIKIPILLYEKKVQAGAKAPGTIRSFLAGIFFAFGWTPCIGPILAGILAIAAAQETATEGMVLLGVYSLGLGVPFILSAVFLNGFFSAFSKLKRHVHKVEIAGGVVLIAIGALILTNNLGFVAQKLAFLNPEALLVKEVPIKEASGGSGPAFDQARPGVLEEETGEQNEEEAKADYGKYEFTLETLEGKTISLSEFGGKIVLVNFWAPWCGPCKQEMPGFERLYEKYQDRGFVIIGVAVQTTIRDIKEFLAEEPVSYLIGMKDEVAEQYGIFGLPDSYLFAPDGSLHKRFFGYTTEDKLEKELQKVLAKRYKGRDSSD